MAQSTNVALAYPYFARVAFLLSLACVFVSLVMLVCVQSTEERERERERERKDKIVGSGENFWFVWRFFCKRVYERGGGFPQLGGCRSELRKASDQLSLHLWL